MFQNDINRLLPFQNGNSSFPSSSPDSHSSGGSAGSSGSTGSHNHTKLQAMIPGEGFHAAAVAAAADPPRNGYDDQKLLDLTERTNYNLVQRNGQRIYGGPPPDWNGPAPEKGCEIFVGKVPRDIYEDELVPIFEKVREKSCWWFNTFLG